jgi:hypothetical protein
LVKNMKKHWTEAAGASVSEQIAALLAGPHRMSDGRASLAQSWLQAMNLAWSVQTDTDPPPTPASDKIAELRAAGDFRELNRLYLLQGLDVEAAQEQRNLIRWQAMRRWASEPSPAERREADLARAQAEAHEAEVEARAQQILAEQNRAALEKARQQARKELAR